MFPDDASKTATLSDSQLKIRSTYTIMLNGLNVHDNSFLIILIFIECLFINFTLIFSLFIYFHTAISLLEPFKRVVKGE